MRRRLLRMTVKPRKSAQLLRHGPMTASEQEWMTTHEAADVLGCSYHHAMALLKALDCERRKHYPTGGMYLWRRIDVVAANELQHLVSLPRTLANTKAAKPGNRSCMCCSKPFMSEGIHNRLCELCTHDAGGFTEHSLRIPQ